MKEDPAAQARALTGRMHAVRVHHFGGLDALMYEEVSRPVPGEGQVLVRVKAAGVGPWDAWVRAGKSALPQPLPLVLGSDLSGIVEDVGPGGLQRPIWRCGLWCHERSVHRRLCRVRHCRRCHDRAQAEAPE